MKGEEISVSDGYGRAWHGEPHLQRVLDDVEGDGFPPASRVTELGRWSFEIVLLIV